MGEDNSPPPPYSPYSPPAPFAAPPLPYSQFQSRLNESERTPLLRENYSIVRPASFGSLPPPYPYEKRKSKTLRKIFVAFILLALGYVVFKSAGKVEEGEVQIVRIAIVGAGPSGVGAAWEVSRQAREAEETMKGFWSLGHGREKTMIKKVEITVFERGERVGGRLVSGIGMGSNSSYSTKGEDSFPLSLRMEDLATTSLLSSSSNFGLQRTASRNLGSKWKYDDTESKTATVGFLDTEDPRIKARLTRPIIKLSWKEYLLMLWRYKIPFLNSKKLPISLKPLLDLPYKHETTNQSSLLLAAGLNKVAGKGAKDWLKEKGIGIGDAYVSEILNSQVKRQFGQEVKEINALALGVAVERENRGVGAIGGNGKVNEALALLLEKTGAEVRFNTEVLGWRESTVLDLDSSSGPGSPKWALQIRKVGEAEDAITTANHKEEEDTYDHIILAAPLSPSLRPLLNIPSSMISYRSIHLTFILLDSDPEPFSTDIDSILPFFSYDHPAVNDSWDGIYEISKVRDVYGPDSEVVIQEVHSLYRIISQAQISHSTLESVFSLDGGNGSVIMARQDWHIENAYPLLWPKTEAEVRELDTQVFKVLGKGNGVWWTGAYECVLGGGVEEAWVMGRRVGGMVTP